MGMTTMLAATQGSGSELASWAPFWTTISLFGLAVTALLVFGRSGDASPRWARGLLRIPNALERLTGIPGWAASTVGLALFGLLVAGEGFYSDVAWHVGLGRDELLFTAPHTSIVTGLGLILLSSVVGVLVASLTATETRLRWKAVRVPWSTVPLFALGVAAVSGFPLDELWHREYGVDVTMWSPTHMLMILGASFTGLAAWLVLFDAGVRPGGTRWARGVHVVAAWLTLQGLIAPLGEFAFGVPQFQHLFHPLILAIGSAFSFVAMRLVLGPWWGLGIATVTMVMQVVGFLDSDSSPVETNAVGVFVASAAVVELTGFLLGTRNRWRFAVVAGLGVGTAGLAGEWWWNQRAHQPWTSALLPDALILCVIAAIGAAIVGAAFASATHWDRDARAVPRPAVAGAAAVVLICLLLPLPRFTGQASAAMTIVPAGDGLANVEVVLSPPTAADDARWFQVTAWQGGGLEVVDMRDLGQGRHVTERPVPIHGRWKTLLRLHRHDELMAMPVYLPADPAIDEPEIPAVDRNQPFESETSFLLRETRPGNGWFKYVIYGLLLLAMSIWATAITRVAGRVTRDPAPRDVPAAVRT